MADTHQVLDSWYEIWFGSDDNRRHFKRIVEPTMLAEVRQLRDDRAAKVAYEAKRAAEEARDPIEVEPLNIEVFKMSVSRDSVNVNEVLDEVLDATVTAPVATANVEGEL